MTWVEKVSACAIAASNDCWSFTSRTALVSSPLLALTTHGYWMSSYGMRSPVTKKMYWTLSILLSKSTPYFPLKIARSQAAHADVRFCDYHIFFFFFSSKKNKCKWRYDRRSGNYNLSNCKLAGKKIGSSKGFEPTAPTLALECSTDWAMKTHVLGAGQFVEFISTHERKET